MQSTLIVAMVIAQLTLVAVCIWALDAQLTEVLDAETYRVHFTAPPQADEFRVRALRILSIFMAVNLATVFLIEVAWKAYVRILLADYRVLMRRIQQLDFTALPTAATAHPLLELAWQWHMVERRRLLGFRHCLEQLEVAEGDARARHDVLAELADLLPRAGPDQAGQRRG